MRTKIFILLWGLLAMIFTLTACTTEDAPEQENKEEQENQYTFEKKTQFGLTEAQRHMMAPMGELGIDILKQFASDMSNGENPIISPLSTYMSLALLANGADGECLEELTKLLGTDDIDMINDFAAQAIDIYPFLSTDSRLEIGNSIWIDRKYTLDETVSSKLKKYYGVSPFSVNFDDSRQVASDMNDLVKEQTHDMINEVYGNGDAPAGPLAAINTLFWNARWLTPFNKDLTKDEEFTNIDGSKTTVEMMYYDQYDIGEYYGDEEVDCFSNIASRYTVLFIVPKTEDFISFIKELSYDKIFDYYCRMKSYSMEEVAIPKFRIDFNADIKGALQGMGTTRIFEPTKWKFTSDGNDELFLGKYFQKTNFYNEEERIGGASATIWESYMGFTWDNQTLPRFRADRPFVFAIIMGTHFTPIYCGVVCNL